jgi:ABC-type spermidine/putrescine transport system permease subunit I
MIGARAAAAHRPPLTARGYLGVLPLLAFLALLFIYPIADLLWLSVLDQQEEFTGEHYRAITANPVWFNVMLITFEISAWTTVFSVVAAYPIAYLLATSAENTRNRLMLWVLLPFWTSFLVRTFAWIVLLSQRGPLNRLVAALGLSDTPLELIYNFTGTMIGMVHALMPLAVLTMLSVMTNIDQRLSSAAATLGARGGEAFWRIYFPLSLPGVAAAALMVFITALGFFITPALLGGRRQTMISQVIIIQVQDLLNWGFAGALSVVLLAAALLIFILYDRLLGLSTLSGGERSGAAAPGRCRDRRPDRGASRPRLRPSADRMGACAPAARRPAAACHRSRRAVDRRHDTRRLPGAAGPDRRTGVVHCREVRDVSAGRVLPALVSRVFRLGDLDRGDLAVLRCRRPDRRAVDAARRSRGIHADPRPAAGQGGAACPDPVAADHSADRRGGGALCRLCACRPGRNFVRTRAGAHRPCRAVRRDHDDGRAQDL